MNNSYQKEICSIISSDVMINESLSKHTSFGIGGPVNCLIFPKNKEELSLILKYTFKNQIPIKFIGSGSNILVWDDGFDGVIISLKKTFKNLKFQNNSQIIAESGVMLGTLVKNAMKNNIAGLESLIGVPGTLGGALIMNAGAFGGEISQFFTEAKTICFNGKIKIYHNKDILFSYRCSSFPNDEILIEATFNCKQGTEDQIQKLKAEASLKRKTNQPLKFRSAGSIFKNPKKGLAAGALIDKAGLKGATEGGACISSKHANFILNLNKATALDVFKLILLAKETVLKQYNINLELEIKLIGFPNHLKKKLDIN